MAYLILLLAIGINFVLAMSEIALVSSRRVRLEGRAAKGSGGATIALKLMEHPTRFLSVIQAGITLVGIFQGAYGERSISSDIAEWIRDNYPYLASYAELISIVAVVLMIGFMSLVFGELVPKRLAMAHPEAIACFVARPIKWLSVAVAPLVSLLAFSTNLVLKILGVNAANQTAVTAEEIRGVIAQGTEEGLIHEKEQELVERVFQLGDLSVTSLMVPRTEITWLRIDLSAAEVSRIIEESARSHYPIFEGELEHPVGVVHVKDLAAAALRGSLTLRSLMVPPLFIPESMSVLRVMEEFAKRRSHIAFVLDEYGGLAGLITFNDIVESVMGRATSRRASTVEDEPEETRRDDGSLLLDGLLPIARVREIVETEDLPKQDAGYKTLAGLLMTNLGKVPRAGDKWVWGPHRFEVMDMDGRRVDKVLYVREATRSDAESARGASNETSGT
ncbi:MAG: hemolysin family protein [Phycisphaerales bacterium]